MGRKLYPRNWTSRRWHSLLGLWLVVYIIEHLIVNSQAAWLVGDDGSGFIHAVNGIHSLPYLPVLEIVVIGLPFAFHAIYGIRYAVTAKFNSRSSDGRKPALPRYSRNHAFTWQRLASWIILIGVILHVIQMRFIDYPRTIVVGGEERLFVTTVPMDEGLYTLASRLGVTLLGRGQIEQLYTQLQVQERTVEHVSEGLQSLGDAGEHYDPALSKEIGLLQQRLLDRALVESLVEKMPKEHQVAVVSDQFGKSLLLTVRATFRDPWMIFLYTIFVLAAVYHAFRGLWSFMIVWGFTLTSRSQHYMSTLAICAMVVLGFLGLSAVWLTYWVNLRT